MDILQFVTTVDPSCEKGMIMNNFGKMMSMFDIIKPHEEDLIQIESIDSISLDLTLPSNELARDIKSRFDRIEMSKYNDSYVVKTTLTENKLRLHLNEVSG